jgi:ribosome recycling factor
MAVSVMGNIPALKEIQQQLKSRMEKAVEDFRANLASTRTGRASVHMLEQVKVPYYGSDMPLNQVAQVTAPEANLILIQPWDPSLLGDIEKALRTSDLGFNPQNDGKIVRIPIPPMTEERRRDVVKHLNKTLEDHRTAVRNIRRDGNELIKKAAKDKKISEDEEKRSLEEIQKLTDDEIRRMEEMCRNKEREVMQV